MYSGGFIWCLGVCIWYFQGVNLASVSGLILYCTWYDAVSDLVVIPFPRRSEIQDQQIWVLRVGNDC